MWLQAWRQQQLGEWCGSTRRILYLLRRATSSWSCRRWSTTSLDARRCAFFTPQTAARPRCPRAHPCAHTDARSHRVLVQPPPVTSAASSVTIAAAAAISPPPVATNVAAEAAANATAAVVAAVGRHYHCRRRRHLHAGRPPPLPPPPPPLSPHRHHHRPRHRRHHRYRYCHRPPSPSHACRPAKKLARC